MSATKYEWKLLADWDERPDDVLVQEGDAIYLARWRDGLWYDIEGHVLVPSAWMPLPQKTADASHHS